MHDAPHRILRQAPVATRETYVGILASVMLAGGGSIDEELHALEEACEVLGLPRERAAEIATRAAAWDAQNLDQRVLKLAGSPLRFTLLTDLLGLAAADRTVRDRERERITPIANRLGVSGEQMRELERAVVARSRLLRALEATEDGEEPTVHEQLMEAAIGLGSVGIPVAAVFAMPATAAYLGTSVPFALAAGGGLLASISGVGVALGIGLGTLAGLRVLLDRLDEARKAHRAP